MAGGIQNFSGRKGHSAPMAEINVTPFVDVILVLLIIFMVTSPMLVAGISVELPETDSAPVTGEDEPLSISVDKEGLVYLQETEITIEEIAPKLAAILGQKNDARIFVRGDKNIDYGKVMDVVGAINAAGYKKVALITEISD